ncbi:MAG: cation diffusion facilitator family transporter [Thermodesulfovibrionales bacterium]|nr:cation diffusion facilitator family transporter [Thermodesulfovibrionales bacterium]
MLLTLFLNLLVSGVKIFYGYFINSVAIISDGFHSLFDGVSNFLGLLGIYLSSHPPDERHPYGHRKYETFFTTFVGFLMFLSCVEIFKKAYESVKSSHIVDVNEASFAIMICSIIVNYFVAKYESSKGKELGSEYLIADSQHTKSDVYISIGVIASLVLIELGISYADVITGIVVGIFVARAGIMIIKEAADSLTDKTKIDKQSIKAVVNQIEGVRDCHDVRTRGTINHVFVDLHISVDSTLSIQEAHEISHEVESLIKRKFPEVVDVLTHIEPHN